MFREGTTELVMVYFSRLRVRGRQFGLILLLAIQAFPRVLSLVPVAQLVTAKGLYANPTELTQADFAGVPAIEVE